ncbi:hypothetical protein TWF694_005760 [Orbilia ellipsospora]|uniref:BTB domain-containing protein n=1 Tax=Orbilia ellipsospora TaxID=2528407 RepID=A0AAV9WT97_9PEZI
MPIIAPLYSIDFSDCVVVAGDPENPVRYETHRNILCIQSPVFKAGLANENFKEGITREFSLPEFNAATMNLVLAWMYKQPVELQSRIRTESDFDLIAEALRALDYLQLKDIKEELIDQIGRQLSVKLPLVGRENTTIRFLDKLYHYGGHIQDSYVDQYLHRVESAGRGKEVSDAISELEDPDIDFLRQMCASLLKRSPYKARKG